MRTLFVAVVLVGLVGCGAKSEGVSVSELEQLFPIPADGRSAWTIDVATADEVKYAAPQNDTERLWLRSAAQFRQSAADNLQRLTARERDVARFVGTRLPHYSLSKLKQSVPNVVELVGRNPSLFDARIYMDRMQEYIKEVGAEQFKAQHPTVAAYAQ